MAKDGGYIALVACDEIEKIRDEFIETLLDWSKTSWDWEAIEKGQGGALIEGRTAKFVTVAQKSGRGVTVWTNAKLERLLSKIPEGEMVGILYVGKHLTAAGHHMNNYRVFREGEGQESLIEGPLTAP